MSSYPNAIPPTAELLDPAALAAIPNNRAPGIDSGAPALLQDVSNASKEVGLRVNAKAMGFAVTDAEVAQSIVRQHAVVSHHAATVGGVVTNADLLTAINARFDAMDARFDAVEARQFNADARAYNAHLLDDHPIRILRKEDVGLLPPTNAMFVAVQSNFVGPAANLNTELPLPFDQPSKNDLNNLTMQQISNLARQAGTDFGIVHGDQVAVRRLKVLRHFTGYGRM